jgi:hypothetical protein
VAVKATTIVTLAQAREWCLQDAADASRDVWISLAADAASERLERETSRVFKRRTLTERADGDGVATVLYLRRFPVLAVSSLTVDGQLVDPTDRYVVDGAAGRVLLTRGAVFPAGVQNLVTVYDAGYEDADLPSDAVELALQLTARLFKMRTKGGSSFEQVTVGGNSFAVRDQLPTDMVKAMARMRDTRFG